MCECVCVCVCVCAVAYTHLTLPTNREGEVCGVAVVWKKKTDIGVRVSIGAQELSKTETRECFHDSACTDNDRSR